MLKPQMTPFNIDLLFINGDIDLQIPRVKTLDIFEGSSKNFHPEGLFSTTLFGPVGDERRNRRFAHIDLKVPVFHPTLFKALCKLKQLYPDVMSGREYAIFDPKLKDFVKSTALEGKTGYHFFTKHFEEIVFADRDSDARRFNVRLVEKYKKNPYIKKLIVLPAGLRDYTVDQNGRASQDEINQFYQNILAMSNVINEASVSLGIESLDITRMKIQSRVSELYDYILSILSGKNKLVLAKWASRQIHYGTGNVISSIIEEIDEANKPTYIKYNETGMGMYQYIKGAAPAVMYELRTGYLSQVFRDGNGPVVLINKKTLTKELVNVPPEYYDEWMTDEGLEKIFNRFGEEDTRHQPLEIYGYWVGLLYFDDKGGFKIFQDINELPPERSKNYVRPITFAELMYCSIFHNAKDRVVYVTRYPAANYGNIYPSFVHLKSTVNDKIGYLLDDMWNRTDIIAPHFPVKGEKFSDTLNPSFAHLGRLGGDYDGDKCYSHIVMSDQAIEEVNKLFNSLSYYVAPNGKLFFSTETDTSKFILASITG